MSSLLFLYCGCQSHSVLFVFRVISVWRYVSHFIACIRERLYNKEWTQHRSFTICRPNCCLSLTSMYSCDWLNCIFFFVNVPVAERQILKMGYIKVSWRTFNLHRTFQLDKSFFRLWKCSQKWTLVPNLYDLISSVEHKITYFEQCFSCFLLLWTKTTSVTFKLSNTLHWNDMKMLSSLTHVHFWMNCPFKNSPCTVKLDLASNNVSLCSL